MVANGATITVLIVDDSPDDAELTQRALRLTGVAAEVLIARDGVEALALLAAWPVHLVLLDLHLPKVDGFDVLDRMRASGMLQRVRVVVLTGSGRTDSWLMKQLGDDVVLLRKPIGTAELRELLNSCGRGEPD